MTSDRLRAAATLLRERAEAATPRAWYAHADESLGMAWLHGEAAGPHDSGNLIFDFREDEDCEDCVPPSWADLRYIATMAPAVTLALADWLEFASQTSYRGPAAALLDAADAVADAILGTNS